MIKRVIGIFALAAIMFSCANNGQKKDAANENDAVKVTVDQVVADMQNYVDKNIIIEGMVNHVCAHGGKRMFLIGSDPEAAIKVTPNEEIGIFEKELEGSTVSVVGVLKELRVDIAYVENLEKELSEGTDNEAIHDHSAGTHDENAENEKKAQIDAMRTQIAESENGYYSQYWIEASKFNVIETPEEEISEIDSIE